jgi:hypothetical protein
MLRSAELHYRQQQRLAAVGLAAARRAWRLGNPVSLTPALTLLMGYAARDGAASVGDMLAEQGIAAQAVGVVNTAAIAADQPLAPALEKVDDVQRLELITLTRLADAARLAAGLAVTVRPHVGWTRMVNPPCCTRCAILAGKWFRWNQGFPRHPKCDCRHVPSTEDRVGDVRTDVSALFTSGQVTGITKAEQRALNDGANVNRVINARHMTLAGGRVHDIYRTAGDNQGLALQLLRRSGYIL